MHKFFTKKNLIDNVAPLAVIVMAMVITIGLMFGTSGSIEDQSRQDGVPSSFNGVWTSAGDPHFSATISNSVIEILIIGTDESGGLYWKGTFTNVAPRTTNNVIEISSNADVDLLDTSLLGSQDPVKVFTYADGILSFKFTAMGVSKIIHLEQ